MTAYQPPTPRFTSDADDYVFGAEDDDDGLFPAPQQQQQHAGPKAPTAFAQQPLTTRQQPSQNSTIASSGQSPLLSSSFSRHGHHPHGGSHQPQPASFSAYRPSPVAQQQAAAHASPTFSDASTTVSPRDVFGDDHIMKKTYPSLFGRAGGNGASGAATQPGAPAGAGTMDPSRDHSSAPAHPPHHPHPHHHLQGRNQVFHSPLSVDSTNTTSPRAIFAPLHTLRSTDSYLSTSSEDEDEVPSPIILPEPQPRPSTSAPHTSSMQYHFGGAGGHAGQASPAWSEGTGLGRELNKVDLGFRPLSGVDRFKAEETSAVAPSSRTVGGTEVDDDQAGAYRPAGPGMGKTAPGGGAFSQVTTMQRDDDHSTEGGTASPQLTQRELSGAEPIDIDYNEDDIPTSSSDSDADDDDDAPYAAKSRPKALTAAAAARRAALGTVSGRGGAARRGGSARGGKGGLGLGRAVRGIGKIKGKPRSALVSRGVSKVRGASVSAGSSSGRASPSGEITYCPFVDPTTKRPCSASFVRFYDLKRHEETVHQMATAATTGAAGASGSKTANAGQPAGFWCERCDRPFSRKDALIRHQKTIPDCWKSRGKPGKAGKK